MARLDKTIQNYKEKLQNKGIDNIPDFIQSILDADITKGKYSRFLLDCFIQDKFREEDLKGGLESTVGQAISLFHKHKRRLSEKQRSVYQYDSPGDLWNAVKQFDGELSGKELKKDEKEKVYAETEFLYEDSETGFKIVCPLTEESAKWWGKGTRWCTSAEKNNMFYEYAKDAPLLIFLMPDGEKLQLWKYEYSIWTDTHNIQFMDEADNEVKIDYIEKNWSILEPVCHWLKNLKFIPEKYKDYDIYMEAIKKDGYAINAVSKKILDYDLCLEAVKQNGHVLRDVPEQHKDYTLCLGAVKQYGESLEFVPKKFRDYNLCLEAVKQDGEALDYVPIKHIDYNLCLEAIKKDGSSLQYVPRKFIDYKLCLETVKNNGYALQYVPKGLIDYNLCLESVKKNGSALQFVPKEYRDYDLCLEAVKKYGLALYSLPEEFKDYTMCLEAVRRNGRTIKDVLRKIRDYNMCLEAVKQDGDGIKYIPEEFRDYNLYLEAVKQDGKILDYVPEEYRDYTLCMEAVKQNSDALDYIPEKYKTEFQNYIDIKQIFREKYQQTFSEIRSIFPEKELSLKL